MNEWMLDLQSIPSIEHGGLIIHQGRGLRPWASASRLRAPLLHLRPTLCGVECPTDDRPVDVPPLVSASLIASSLQVCSRGCKNFPPPRTYP